MKKKTINTLIKMGLPANLLGFKYITDIMCLYEDEHYRNGKLMNVYQEIARMNNSTSSRVERAIRHAFETIRFRSNCPSEIIEQYLTTQNPTNGNLLHVLYLRLSMED